MPDIANVLSTLLFLPRSMDIAKASSSNVPHRSDYIEIVAGACSSH